MLVRGKECIESLVLDFNRYSLAVVRKMNERVLFARIDRRGNCRCARGYDAQQLCRFVKPMCAVDGELVEALPESIRIPIEK